MGINIGLDIGSVSLKFAAIGVSADGPLFRTLTEEHATYFASQFPNSSPYADRPLVLSRYRRIQGSPIQSTFELLKEFYDRIPEHNVEGIRVTGSGGQLIARNLGTSFENDFRAVAKGIRAFHPEVRTIFEMGGESSKYLRLEPFVYPGRLGIADYQTGGECAAGTGSFIDQQASRLLYSVEEVGPVACRASCAARIAGRCSVFAKTDMIHAQQRGYSTDQILQGLCDAVARNFKSSIVKGHPVQTPVAFIGGVALNQGVTNALRRVFNLEDSAFFVPALQAWIGAVGAAMLEAEEQRQRCFKCIEKLEPFRSTGRVFEYGDPLSMSNVVLLDDSVKQVEPLPPGQKATAYLGIDIGSVSTNLVVLDAQGNLLKEIYLYTEGRPIEVVARGLKEIEAELGSSLNIRGVGTTGSGRELIGELIGADTVNDEITAHKTGAMQVCKQLNMESVDTIFEIGGQDSKFIRLEQGVVVDFTMNEACAAGTGSFLEEQAEKLGVSIKKEFARLALASKHPARLGERCTVFMERDVTALLQKGMKVGDLTAGLAYSVALNYLNRVVRGRKIGKVIFFQGGTSYNDAVTAAFSQIIGKTIIVPPHSGVMGAIGVAILAFEHMKDSGGPSRFRGYDLHKVNFSTREFVCQACSNRCDMKEFNIEGQRSYWGDKCSDKFRKHARSDRKPVIADLIEFHARLLEEVRLPPKGNQPTVGIPRTMFYYDRFPFWCAYFQELDFDVVVSSPTDRKISAAGEEATTAQPCFPVMVAHGHIVDLGEKKVDYILLPNVLNAEAPATQVNSYLCPWNQTLPFVVRASPQLESLQKKFLIPTVHFRLGVKHVENELRKFTFRLGVSPKKNRKALMAAYRAQGAFQDGLLEAGADALCRLKATGEPALVLVGRPYNIYDHSINCDIPRKLRTLYGANVLPMDFLPLDVEDISDVNPNMYWNSGRRILSAARFVRRYTNLHLIYISNFKCGPDTYIKSFLNDASGKPSLLLQFDGHSNDAGFITRCEAYLDSKGVLRCSSSAAAA
jgi:predicted CoA-substrate-specific enzyme activase